MISRWWWTPNRRGEIWPKDRFVRSFDGTEIRYTLLGPEDGPVVTLCAGFVCPDNFWRHLVPGLQDAFRVLVWNYRGVGMSRLPRNPGYHCLAIRPEELSIETNARDLLQILRSEDIRRTALVGHSMGVQTALECYRQFPVRAAALVLIAGAYRSPLRTLYGTDLSAKLLPAGLPLLHFFPRATLLVWRGLLRSPVTHVVAQKVVRGVGPETRAEDMAGFYDHLSMVDPLIAAKMVRGIHDHSAEDLLERIDVPTLILHGSKDTFTPPRVARVMAQRVPGARLEMFEGASHGLPVERPDAVLAVLRPFLEKAFAG